MLDSNTVDQFVAEPVMVAFAMIVDEGLGERTAEVPLTKRNKAVQAFLFDGANKPLRVRIAVRRAERCPDYSHTGRLKQVSNRGTPLPIAIADQEASSDSSRTSARSATGSPLAPHVLGDGRLTDLDAELAQFAVDPRHPL
jgi:hypothetical protein